MLFKRTYGAVSGWFEYVWWICTRVRAFVHDLNGSQSWYSPCSPQLTFGRNCGSSEYLHRLPCGILVEDVTAIWSFYVAPVVPTYKKHLAIRSSELTHRRVAPSEQSRISDDLCANLASWPERRTSGRRRQRTSPYFMSRRARFTTTLSPFKRAVREERVRRDEAAQSV